MLRLPRFRFVSPPSIEEAIHIRTEHPATSMYVAGGTDVYPKMKRRQFQPEVVIAIGGLVRDDFRGGTLAPLADTLPSVAEEGPLPLGPLPLGLRIGAGATLTEVAEHPKLREGYRALSIAAGRVSTSSPRCLAVASADTVPALIALGAQINVVGPNGARTIDLAECYREDGINYLALEPGEIVTEIVLPPSDGWRSTYLKQRDRNSFDFPIAGVAAAVRMDRGVVTDARVAITALGSRPVRVDASALVGTKLDDEAIGAVADATHKAARPMDNTSGTISQRKRAARVFADRALRSLRDD